MRYRGEHNKNWSPMRGIRVHWSRDHVLRTCVTISCVKRSCVTISCVETSCVEISCVEISGGTLVWRVCTSLRVHTDNLAS